jgi:pyrroloquinoline quinone biosynthesis protein B
VTPRSQESVAVSADGNAWFLLNASPEIRAQVESFSPLHPRGPRHSPIAGIVLTNGDLDHCLGLLSLRESHPLRVYATRAVRDGWTEGNLLHRTLQRFEHQVSWTTLVPGASSPLLCADGTPSGLVIEAVSVPGKLPIHLEHLRPPSAEDNIGLLLREPARGATLGYFPAVGSPSPGLASALAAAQCIFFDGTFWSSDELGAQGLGDKRAEDMAHWPLSGADGSLAFLAALAASVSDAAAAHASRCVLIHVNNTNPVLRDDSPEAARVRQARVEIARDGMEILL